MYAHVTALALALFLFVVLVLLFVLLCLFPPLFLFFFLFFFFFFFFFFSISFFFFFFSRSGRFHHEHTPWCLEVVALVVFLGAVLALYHPNLKRQSTKLARERSLQECGILLSERAR